MATVRFSESLKSSIRSNANKMFDDEIQKQEDSFPKDMLDGIVSKFMGDDFLTNVHVLPKEMFNWVQEIDVRFRGEINGVVRIKVPPNTYPVPVNKIVTRKGMYDPSYHRIPDIRLDPDCEDWEAIKAEWLAWLERKNTAVAKRQEFLEMVSTIMEVHATLAPALKTWPPLWDLLPEDARSKHREIKDRKSTKDRKEELLQEVDLSKMTAAVTLNKLSGK